MQTHFDVPKHSIMTEALDLIVQLEKERAELDNDVVRQLIPRHEAHQIRVSINRIIADLKSMLGVTDRTVEEPKGVLLERAAQDFITGSMYEQ